MTFYEFTDAYFEGDKEKSLRHLAYEGAHRDFMLTGNNEFFKTLIDTMESEDANRYMVYFSAELHHHPEIDQTVTRTAALLTELDMTKEELVESKKNPFVKKTLMSLIFVLCIFVAMIAFFFIKKVFNIENEVADKIVHYIITISLSSCACSIAFNALKIPTFNRAKKFLAGKPNTVTTEQCNKKIDKPKTFTEPKYAPMTTVKEIERAVKDSKFITKISCLKAFESPTAFYWISGLLACSMLLLCLLTACSVYFSIPLAIVILLYGVVFICDKHQKNRINKFDFCIKKGICIDKKTYFNSENPEFSTFTLIFDNRKKFRVSFFKYDATEIGDEHYLLHLGKSKKIRDIFKYSPDAISQEDFYQENDCFYPKKIHGESTAALLESSMPENNDALTEEERISIKATRMLDEIKKKNIILSLMAIFFVIVGIVSAIRIFSAIGCVIFGEFCVIPAVLELIKMQNRVKEICNTPSFDTKRHKHIINSLKINKFVTIFMTIMAVVVLMFNIMTVFMYIIQGKTSYMAMPVLTKK